MIAVTGKKRGAEVAEIEKLKASRGEWGEGVPSRGLAERCKLPQLGPGRLQLCCLSMLQRARL